MENQKHLFEIPEHVTYLNCAYMSPITTRVRQAGQLALEQKLRPYEIKVEDFFEPVTRLKQLFAQLINAPEPLRIAVLPSVSYALATVAKNLPATAGENIVCLEEQFPSNIYSWRRLCSEQDLELRVVSVPQSSPDRGQLWNQKLIEAIDHQTAAVAVGTVHWADGTLLDLEQIRARTREVGAILILDGTQSIGARPFDLAALNPDVVVCAGYKWLMGPYALSVAYYGPSFDAGIPIEESWINRLGSEDFKGLTQYEDQYHPFATRYDMGEKSNFFLLPILSTALEQILEWGVANIDEHCRQITEGFVEEVLGMGFLVEDQAHRANHMFGIRLPENVHLNRLKHSLEQEQVYVSLRGDAVRIAPHLYNDREDLKKLSDCLKSALK